MGRGVGDREGPKMAVSAEGALGVVGQGALCWAPSILVSPAPPSDTREDTWEAVL